MKRRIFTYLVLLFLLSANVYAQKAGDVISFSIIPDGEGNPNILSVEETQDLINALAPDIGLSPSVINLLTDIDFPIQRYKVFYYTEPLNKGEDPVVASGLVVLPLTDCPLDMLVYGHGTVFGDKTVPTQLGSAGNNAELIFAYLYGGNGYLTVLPDFYGLGDDIEDQPSSLTDKEDKFHTYLDEKTGASSTFDLMIAVKGLAKENGIKLTHDVAIAGYSQGGHTGMSTFKFMQENKFKKKVRKAGFHLERAGLGAGPYNLKGVQFDAIANDANYPRPEFVPYIIAACQEAGFDVYDVDANGLPIDVFQTNVSLEVGGEPITVNFSADYNENILGQTGDTLFWTLVNSYVDFLQPEFAAQVTTKSPSNAIFNCLKENDISDWDNRLPLVMYYCSDDKTVVPSNSTITEQNLDENLPFWLFWLKPLIRSTDLGDYDHANCVIPYALISKARFDLFQTNCLQDIINLRSEDPQNTSKADKLVLRPVNYYHLDVLADKLSAPIQRIELQKFDGAIAATFTGFETVNGIIRLDVRQLDRAAYLLQVYDVNGHTVDDLAVLESVELIEHKDYNPLAIDLENEEYQLDVSLLTETVESLVIYTREGNVVREVDVNNALNQITFSSQGVFNGDYILEVRTKVNSYFLPLKPKTRTISIDGFSVYPNPAKDYVVISLDKNETISAVSIFDAQGKLVWNQQKMQVNLFRPQLELTAGIYHLQVVSSSGKVFVEKLVILD